MWPVIVLGLKFEACYFFWVDRKYSQMSIPVRIYAECPPEVSDPNPIFGRSVAAPCEKVILAFERSRITYAVRKSMLDMPVPGSF